MRKALGHGERGFALIELLIVIAILGILAALIIPNVTTFMESGRVGAGRAERSGLQVAVDGAMADGGCGELTTAPVTDWQGEEGVVICGDVLDPPFYDANDYVRRFPTEGFYNVDIEGTVTCNTYPGLDATGWARINE